MRSNKSKRVLPEFVQHAIKEAYDQSNDATGEKSGETRAILALLCIEHLVQKGAQLSFDIMNMLQADMSLLSDEQKDWCREHALELEPEHIGDIYQASLPDYKRKTEGVFYTPVTLIEPLIDRALHPVMEDRLREAVGEEEWEAVGGTMFDDKGIPKVDEHGKRVVRDWSKATPEAREKAERAIVAHSRKYQ